MKFKLAGLHSKPQASTSFASRVGIVLCVSLAIVACLHLTLDRRDFEVSIFSNGEPVLQLKRVSAARAVSVAGIQHGDAGVAEGEDAAVKSGAEKLSQVLAASESGTAGLEAAGSESTAEAGPAEELGTEAGPGDESAAEAGPADGQQPQDEAGRAEQGATAVESVEKSTAMSKPAPAKKAPSVAVASSSADNASTSSAISVPMPQATRAACEPLQLCSVGKVGHFVGDVATNEALRELLTAVSYKTEVVMVLSSAEPQEMMGALNLHLSMADLGMAHLFILTWAPSECHAIAEAYKSSVSCAWDSARATDVEADGHFDVQIRRWEVVARIVRMGYNVLSLDYDCYLLDNPYTYLKSPLLGTYNVLTQPDGEWDASVNSGMVYLQNCHPSGPCMWMLKELVDRTYRQRGNISAMVEVYPGFSVTNTWDQAMWNDMVRSAISGRLAIHTALEEQLQEDWVDIMTAEAPASFERVMFDWPQDWWQRTALKQGHVWANQLQLPTTGSPAWWRAHCGRFYPPTRQQSSSERMQLLFEANPSFPLWDPEHPWAPEAAPEVPAEHWAAMPPWLGSSYIARGQYGYWATTPPAQVLGHAAFNAGPVDSVWQLYVPRMFGWWHWEVSEAYAAAGSMIGYPVGLPGENLLMLAPGVQLYTETEDGFRLEVLKLIRLAQALGRRMVIPNPPCDSVWIGVWNTTQNRHEEGERAALESGELTLWPSYFDGFQTIQAPDLQRPERSYCQWMRLLSIKCVQSLPTHIDALAYLERLDPPQDTAAGPGNTAWYKEWQAAGGADIESPDWTSKPVLELSTSQAALHALAALDSGAGSPVVLYLGALPRYTEESTADELAEEEPHVKDCWLFAPGFDAAFDLPHNDEAEDRQRARHGLPPQHKPEEGQPGQAEKAPEKAQPVGVEQAPEEEQTASEEQAVEEVQQAVKEEQPAEVEQAAEEKQAAEEEEQPAEGEQAAEEEEQPAEVEQPAEGKQPVDGEQTAEGEQAAEEEEQPAEVEQPAEGEQAAAEEEQPAEAEQPAEGEQAAAEEEQPAEAEQLAEGEQAAEKEEQPAEGEQAVEDEQPAEVELETQEEQEDDAAEDVDVYLR